MNPLLLAPSESRPLAAAVAREMGVELSPVEERTFPDGEFKIRPLTSVRERDAYVLHGLYGEPGATAADKLLRLAFLCGAVRDAGAARVTAVVPYLCFARKERKTQPRDPVATRYVAGMLESVGVDRVVGLDVHDLASFQNAFRSARTEHLEARPVFVEHLARLGDDIAVVSPDVGGVKRAQRIVESLALRLGRPVPLAFMEKRRQRGVMTGGSLIGDVRGRVAVIVDDLVASGGTLARAAESCRDGGAVRVEALATHGLFVGDASRTLAEAPLDVVAVTDSVPPFRLDSAVRDDKLVVLSVAPLLGEAVRRLASGGSIVELLGP